MSSVDSRPKFILRAKQLKISLGRQTKIMGILNLTPDSFSQDGLLAQNIKDIPQRALAAAQKMVSDGADIIDIGGESTRPGARQITTREEIARIIPAIRLIAKKLKQPISVDTYKEVVARHALDAGASIVNNIKGTLFNGRILRIVKNYNAAIILMHIRGTPQTMQSGIHYRNLIPEILTELRNSIEKCLEIGIKSDRIVIDPGIGFGKTVEHNLEILKRLSAFKILKQPILVGTSRKSFIGHILKNSADERLLGTAATVSAAIINGAHIVRVHDVPEIKNVAVMTDAIINIKTDG